MKTESTWKEYWEGKFASSQSHFEADRGTGQRDADLNRLSDEELLEFINPRPEDVVFDAGCGTGANILLIHKNVRRVIAMDFAESAVKRGLARLAEADVRNVEMRQGDIMNTELSHSSVDKVICLSVFHYLSDEQVRACLRSFARMLRPNGTLIIHVKNLASPYLGSLQAAKRILRLLGRRGNLNEQFRTFDWYVRELKAVGFEVVAFNSFNLLMLDRMPERLVRRLQRLELTQRKRFPFNTALWRRHGADLKFRARLTS